LALIAPTVLAVPCRPRSSAANGQAPTALAIRSAPTFFARREDRHAGANSGLDHERLVASTGHLKQGR
jgi:hypothetical protein